MRLLTEGHSNFDYFTVLLASEPKATKSFYKHFAFIHIHIYIRIGKKSKRIYAKMYTAITNDSCFSFLQFQLFLQKSIT